MRILATVLLLVAAGAAVSLGEPVVHSLALGNAPLDSRPAYVATARAAGFGVEPIAELTTVPIIGNSPPGPGNSTQQPEQPSATPTAVDPGDGVVTAKCTPGLSDIKIARLLNQTGYIFHVTIYDCGFTDVGARCSFTYKRTDGGSANVSTYFVDSHFSSGSHYCSDIRGSNHIVPGGWSVTAKVYGEINGNASTSRAFTILRDGSVQTRA